MASRDDDNLEWLYRNQEKPSADETRIDDSPAPDVPAEPDSGRRRMTFVDDGSTPAATERPRRMSFTEDEHTPRRRPSTAGPRPMPAPRPQPAPPAQRPTPQRPPATRRRRRRPVRTVLVTLLVLVLLFAVYLVGVPMLAWNQTARIDAMPTGERPPEQPGTVYLLVGSDGRENLSPEERARLGTGAVEGHRADTTMLLVVPSTGEPALISLPRDSYVEIPGYGKNKLNAAFALEGPQLLVATIEHNTGVRIDKYVEIGFGGFSNVIDALGGIEMCLDKPIQDRDSHLDLPAGCQNLDGKNALGYVRMRKADPTGDIGRMKRQQEMISAMMKKAANPANVLLPNRYWALSNAAASSVAVDNDTSVFDAAKMGQAMLGVTRGGLTLTVPISDPNASTSAGSSVLWDEAGAEEMFGKVAQGDTTGLEKFAKKK